MRLAGVLTVGALLLVMLVPCPASASQLRWDGPGACVEPERLRFQVERALGTSLERAGTLEFEVSVEPSTLRAHLRLSSPHGEGVDERILTAPSCSELEDKLAVAISLAIGSATESQPSIAPAAGPHAAPELPKPSPAVDATSANTRKQTRHGPRPSVLALLAGDLGSLPAPALGAALGVQLAWQSLELRALATLFFDQNAPSTPVTGGAGGEIGLYFGTLLACNDLLGGRASSFSVPWCAGADLGQLSGSGRGVAEARRRASLWLAPRVDAGLSWQIPETQLAVQLQLGAAVPLNRDRFVLDDIGTVHQPSRVVGRACLGIDLAFE